MSNVEMYVVAGTWVAAGLFGGAPAVALVVVAQFTIGFLATRMNFC